ncbi:MAG: DUF4384 domain-containing protein [Limnobacter sp.]|nr:DUF4384 domain-containing protein [Limnobacter sp.]
MKSQIAKTTRVCKSGLLVLPLWAALLCAVPGWAQAQAEVQTEINTPANVSVIAPIHGLVNWPGAVVYPKLNEGKPLMTLAAGERVELLEQSNLWWKIRHGDQVGWINRLLLEPSTAEETRPDFPKPEGVPRVSQGAQPILNLPEQPPAKPLSTPEPEPLARSAFQTSMLELDAAWKAKFQKRGLDAKQPDEQFTAQLMKNSKLAWAPQVIAPSRLVIGKDYFKLWLKSSKAGFVYVWSEAEDGELTLVFPNQRDMDHRVTAGEILYLPRKNWQIKSTGPAGQSRLMVMVSEVPRALPPPAPLMDEISASLAPDYLPSLVGHEVLKRHPFWMSTQTALGDNPALLHFLNPDLSKEDCNPKKPQCSNNYGVKSIKLMKVEPVP